MKVHS